MVVKTEEKTEESESKLAESFSGGMQKTSEELEQDADDIINEMYHPDKFEEDQKAKKETEEAEAAKQKDEEKEDKSTDEDPADKDDKTKDSTKDEKPATDKTDVVEDEIVADDADDIAQLKEKLTKSEQRVRDNRKAFSTSKKELSDERIASKAVIDTFSQTIKDLQGSISQKTEASTEQEEKVADKEIQETAIDLKAQFEKLNNIDPDIAAPIKEIIEGLTENITGLKGQMTNLKSEIKTKEETISKTAQEAADNEHFTKIDNAHPDNEKITDSDEFNEYIDGLSPRNKRLARQDLKNGSAENIIELIDDYKTASDITTTDTDKTTKDKDTEEPDTTKTDTKSEKLEKVKKMVGPNLNKSKEFKTSKKVVYTRAMLKTMSPEEYEKHEADIDKEMAVGNIPDR